MSDSIFASPEFADQVKAAVDKAAAMRAEYDALLARRSRDGVDHKRVIHLHVMLPKAEHEADVLTKALHDFTQPARDHSDDHLPLPVPQFHPPWYRVMT